MENLLSVEALKRVNLREFFSQYYGLTFQKRGGAYVCLSPFTQEQEPSFFVRLVGEHWLSEDFSSGAGGTIFDFVQIKEKLTSFSEALCFLRKLFASSSSFMTEEGPCGGTLPEGHTAEGASRPYDAEQLYGLFRRGDPGPCRKYLRERGIDPQLVEALIAEGTVVHNRHQGRSYVCFAVRDAAGTLRCLDNHEIGGAGKFLLGRKSPFSCEWDAVRASKVVFVSEGIIDYLSVKSLQCDPLPGLALLGNKLCFEPSLLQAAEVIVAAVHDDPGGTSCVLDLQQMYPEKEVRLYDLEGYKDPNDFLLGIRLGKGRNLNAERKLQLYREFQQSRNKTELARRWGIDRSYLYEIVRECEKALLESFSGRKSGRPPKGKPTTLKEALERMEHLEELYEREAHEKLYCRSEFLSLRLKWAEREVRELRGEKVNDDDRPKKSQVKKKKNRRRSRR